MDSSVNCLEKTKWDFFGDLLQEVLEKSLEISSTKIDQLQTEKKLYIYIW